MKFRGKHIPKSHVQVGKRLLVLRLGVKNSLFVAHGMKFLHQSITNWLSIAVLPFWISIIDTDFPAKPLACPIYFVQPGASFGLWFRLICTAKAWKQIAVNDSRPMVSRFSRSSDLGMGRGRCAWTTHSTAVVTHVVQNLDKRRQILRILIFKL